jgi:hypothetical protein
MPIALRQLQAEKPAYRGESGAEGWWSEVIKRTALGAGGDPQGIPNFPKHFNFLFTHVDCRCYSSCECLHFQDCSKSDD